MRLAIPRGRVAPVSTLLFACGATGSATGGASDAGSGGDLAGLVTSGAGTTAQPPLLQNHGGSAAGFTTTGGAGQAAAGGGVPASGGSADITPLQGTPLVYVGCFGSGVRAYTLDPATGELRQRGGDFDAGPSPSYLALDRSRAYLYAANADDSPAGGVTALAIQSDGSLQRINHQSGSDGGFAHLAVSPDGKFVVAAAFGGGSVAVFPIASDGSLQPEVANLDLGDGSEAHGVAFVGTGGYLLVPTRGNDRLNQLRLHGDGMLQLNEPPFIAAARGAGPRHVAVHPNGQQAFLLNEKSSTVSSYRISADGTLTEVQTLSTLPPNFASGNDAAHIEVSPDGRFVYTSNRGHDSIAVFAADATSGMLTFVEHEVTRGVTPRDFDVDPNGKVVVVANQETSTLSVYHIEADGRLTPLGNPTKTLSNPTAVQICYP